MPGFQAKKAVDAKALMRKRPFAASQAMPLGPGAWSKVATTLYWRPVTCTTQSWPGCVICPLSSKRMPVSVM